MAKQPKKLDSAEEAIDYLFGSEPEGLSEDSEQLIRETVQAAIMEHTEAKITEAVEQQTNQLIEREIAEMLPTLLDDKLAHFRTFPREIVVVHKEEDGTEIERLNIGVQHYKFDELRIMIRCRTHTALIGPMGSGKTRATAMSAKAAGLPFYKLSVGPQTAQSQLLGYMDAKGRYIRTALRDALEYGGVILLDEFDTAHPGVATTINGLVDGNETAGFPDGIVRVHPDFVCVLNMNTFGRGADRTYVARTELDGATMDRFACLEWPYDEDLERAIVPLNPTWVSWVQAIRHAIIRLDIRHPVSPRASIMGDRLLRAGLSRETVEDSLIWKGLAQVQIDKILAWVRDNPE
jgi:AAA domain (dynein-related subfamily)